MRLDQQALVHMAIGVGLGAAAAEVMSWPLLRWSNSRPNVMKWSLRAAALAMWAIFAFHTCILVARLIREGRYMPNLPQQVPRMVLSFMTFLPFTLLLFPIRQFAIRTGVVRRSLGPVSLTTALIPATVLGATFLFKMNTVWIHGHPGRAATPEVMFPVLAGEMALLFLSAKLMARWIKNERLSNQSVQATK